MNIACELIKKAKEKFGDSHIVSYYNKTSFSVQYYEKTTKILVNQFETMKIPNNTVAILLFEDNPTAISVFLACIKYGIVPLLAGKKNDNDVFFDYFIPSIIISDDENKLKEINHRVSLMHISNVDDRLSARIICFNNEPSSYIDSEETAYLGMTSGSSGTPKYVMHGHSEMLFASESFGCNTLQLTENDVIFSVPKMNFTYGLANSLFFSFVSGAPAILIDQRYSAEKTLEIMNYYKPTCFFAVPSIYNDLMLFETIKNTPLKSAFESVRLCVSSGEYLRSDIIEKWYCLTNHYISDSVGCSETGSGFLFNSDPQNKTGSAGVPVCGYQLHLLVGEGLKGGNEGILCVNGESNANGYFNSPIETEKKFMNGWVRTGDIFRVDDDGYYWYIGREDKMIKHHGFWVSPTQVENVIKEFNGIIDCCVVKTERNSRDFIASYICVNHNFSNILDLKQFLKTRLKGFEIPQVYRIVDSIPLNINGKNDIKTLEIDAKRIIITIDGPAKVGKSTVSDEIANKYGLCHIQAGVFFRIVAWCLKENIINKADLDQADIIRTILDKVEIDKSTLSIGEKEVDLRLIQDENMAAITANISKNQTVQNQVIAYLKDMVKGYSAIIDGRNMGADVFPDADLKFYFNGTIEKSVEKWCKKTHQGQDVYNRGVKNLFERNSSDSNRAVFPLVKPTDAIEIDTDDKDINQLINIISPYIDSIL